MRWSMLINWVLLAFLVLLVAYSWFRVERGIRFHEREVGRLTNERVQGLAYLLLTLRKNSTRYEIEISDWGPQHLDMRFRWTIWDADALLATQVNPDVAEMGNTVPFMLGNAATRTVAEFQALAWVREKGSNEMVVTP